MQFDYALGYLVADGCVTDTPSGGPRLLWLSTDEQIIQDLALDLGTSKPSVQLGKNKPCWRTGKAGIEFCKPFLDAGVVRRKTYDLKEISTNNFPDFLRGFTDGDGGIHFQEIKGRHYIQVAYSVKSEPFSKWLEAILLEHGVEGRRDFYQRKDRPGSWWRLSTTGINALKLLKLAYLRPGLRLKRKEQVISDVFGAQTRGTLKTARR